MDWSELLCQHYAEKNTKPSDRPLKGPQHDSGDFRHRDFYTIQACRVIGDLQELEKKIFMVGV
jgi:hypothetical protein